MPAQRAEFRPARSRSTSSVVVVDEPDADRLILAAEPQIQVGRVHVQSCAHTPISSAARWRTTSAERTPATLIRNGGTRRSATAARRPSRHRERAQEPLAETALVRDDRVEPSDRVEVVEGRCETREHLVGKRPGLEPPPERVLAAGRALYGRQDSSRDCDRRRCRGAAPQNLYGEQMSTSASITRTSIGSWDA